MSVPDPNRPQRDHLAALSVAGTDRASVGFYTPDRLDLTLTGADQATDLVVYVHETHHQVLNDSTAWGAALHVLSALGPRYRACFTPLLDACRLTHEAYATFASVSIVAVHHADAEVVLEQYPDYARLHRSLTALTAAAAGPHRGYMLATALARVSMQTPVLAAMLASDDLTVTASDLPTIDTPDGRWRFLIRAGRDLTDRASRAADAHVAHTLGTAGLDADVAGGPAAATVAAKFDDYWETWERAAYDVLTEALAGAGATVLPFKGHMEPSREVVRRARKIDPALPLRAGRPNSPAQDDATLLGATIQFVRLNLVDTPRRARLDTTSVRDLARSVGADGGGTSARDHAAATLHVRLPQRMLDSYRWPAADAAVLEAAEGPIVAVRRIDSNAEESIIAHVCLPKPGALHDLARTRTGQPPLVTVAAASCFIDVAWSTAWVPAIREAGPLVVLIDIEAARFVGSWVRDQRQIKASVIRVGDTTGVYWATALLVGEDPAMWLHLGDEVTVKLQLDQLRGTDGLLLDVSPDHVQDAAPLLTQVISHLLATESFLDLRGLDPTTLSRVASLRCQQVSEDASGHL